MSISTVKKTKQWLEDMAARSNERPLLVLYHLNIHGRKTQLWEDDSEEEWKDPENLAIKIVDEARNHAQNTPGAQKYNLSAYGHEDLDRIHPLKVHFLSLDASVAGEGDYAGSEPPTPDGLLAQLMRHNQEMHRQNNSVLGVLTSHMAKTIEMQQVQIERLMADRLSTVTTMEELMSRKHEREQEVHEKEASRRRKDETWKGVMQLLPVAVNKLAGKEIVRQSDTLLEMTAMEFVQTLVGSKFDLLQNSGALDRNQLILLQTLIDQTSKRLVSIDERQKQSEEVKGSAFDLGSALASVIKAGATAAVQPASPAPASSPAPSK
jgi:hypothetical protein